MVPLDEQTREFLATRAKDITIHRGMSVKEVRSWDTNLPLAADREPVAHVEDRFIPGPGGPLRIRIYRPEVDHQVGALVYFHGGGHVSGSVEVADVSCRALTNGAGCVVVSVDYRLAPEHPFPEPVEDCYAAATWVVEHAGELEIDPARVAVGGSSAGSNLAGAVCMVAKDRGGPRFVHQLLVYGSFDYDPTAESYRAYGEGYYLTAESLSWYRDKYVPREEDREHRYFAMVNAPDLSGLPPATFVTAEYDPTRNSSERYAARLREAGVPVEVRQYDGVVHGFVSFAAIFDTGRHALDDVSAILSRVIGRES
jgi:acetyl esterase